MRPITEQEFYRRCNDIDAEDDNGRSLIGLSFAAISGGLVVGMIWLLVEWL